jgi:hypothetical protein
MAILAGTVSNGSKAAGLVATVMLFLFNFFFAVGLLAIPWLLPAEYAPLAIRTKAAALATASNCTYLSIRTLNFSRDLLLSQGSSPFLLLRSLQSVFRQLGTRHTCISAYLTFASYL